MAVLTLAFVGISTTAIGKATAAAVVTGLTVGVGRALDRRNNNRVEQNRQSRKQASLKEQGYYIQKDNMLLEDDLEDLEKLLNTIPRGRVRVDASFTYPEDYRAKMVELTRGRSVSTPRVLEAKGKPRPVGPNDKLPQQGLVDGGYPDGAPVDAGKQGKHVPGHRNAKDPRRSKWKEGENGVRETQEAWKKGDKDQGFKKDGEVKIHDFKRPIGPKGETRVRVHGDNKGHIHGYPID